MGFSISRSDGIYQGGFIDYFIFSTIICLTKCGMKLKLAQLYIIFKKVINTYKITLRVYGSLKGLPKFW